MVYYIARLKKEIDISVLAIGLSNYIGYGIQPYISKDHIWAAMRWGTIIIPFLIIMGVPGIQVLYRWLRKKYELIGEILCVCMIIGIFGFLIYQRKLFIVTKIMEDLDTEIEALANQLADNQLYITDNEEVASYLHYVYNKQVYYSTLDNEEAIEQYIAKNQGLNYI